MRRHNDIEYDYFSWMYSLVCGDRFPPGVSFTKLLSYLHSVEFVYDIPRDENRAEDGIDLRYRFALAYDVIENADDYLGGPCSVLEMIIALAFKIEETMDDPRMGDRMPQWFWNMIVSLGLGSMNDERYDEDHVRKVIMIFLNREYEPNGKGGLFTVRGCREDLSSMEIWRQMCLYLDAIN